ncbi:MAG: hypothetical protein IJ588_11935 [Prevotella sp.]|nr:hypothetical protein [Prevotella sp.]
MKKKLLFCLLLGLAVCGAKGQSRIPSEQEDSVLREHYEELKASAYTIYNEAYTALCLKYNVPKSARKPLRHWLALREERKVAQNYIYPDSIVKRVMAKNALDELYQDSIDIILIPYNSNISGENISYALKIASALNLDSAQHDYLKEQALVFARQLRENPRKDIWDQEMKILTNTLSKKQQDRFFSLKNGVKVGAKTRQTWEKLKDAGLTEELDSASEWARTVMYYSEEQKVWDLYKKNANLRKKNLAELSRQMPPAVRMLDALEKQRRYEEKKGNAVKELVW